MNSERSSARGATVLGLVAVAAVFLLHAWFLEVVAEDAFIAFRFASHLAGGHGLVWNLGEPPVEGYTDFLWILLCAAALRAGAGVALFAQLLGVLAGLGTLAYTWQFGRRVMGMTWPMSLVAPALLALSGPFATWSASGMETVLFAFFVAGACYHAAVSWTSAKRLGQAMLASLFLIAATLTRPEGVLVAGVVITSSALLGPRPVLRRDVVVPALVFGAAMVVYEWWRVSYFGQWLPNTYYAKVGGSPLRYVRGLIYSGAFVAYFVLPFFPLLVIAARKRPRAELFAAMRTARAGTWMSLSLVVCYAAYIAWAGGDYMAMYRFFVPLLPALYLVVAAVLSVALSRNSRGRAFGLLAAGAFVTVFHSLPLDRYVFPKPPLQHGDYVGVKTERWHNARLTLIGEFFRDYDNPEGASLATDAIGAISYYSRLNVYGFHGLVDPHIAHERARGTRPGLGLPGHEKGNLSYILSKRPTYIMFNRRLTAEPSGYPEAMAPKVHAELARDYAPVSVWLEDDVNKESGYFTFYARREAVGNR